MAITHNKKRRQNNVLYTIVVSILIIAVIVSMISFFYEAAEQEAYEMLHLQTKQIKDDLTLQIKSDRENLATMSYVAAELYVDGESYDQIFDSFKPIGLFSNIGILTPDNVLYTKKGNVDLSGKISFAEEAKRGQYISGRIPDLTRDGDEIIRSAVPIVADDEIVGIMYGVIKLNTIHQRYNYKALELDAQLFVYDKASGDYVINTVEGPTGNVSSLKDRKYNDHYTYESLIANQNGFSSFDSIVNGNELYIHYSTIEDLNWGIILARNESQVFKKVDTTLKVILTALVAVFLIIVAYILYLMKNEKRRASVVSGASNIRRLLLDINQSDENITSALKTISEFSNSRSSFVVDADGDEFNYSDLRYRDVILGDSEKKFFVSELFKFAATLHNHSKNTVGVMHIRVDKRMAKTNRAFYDTLKEHMVTSIAYAYVVDKYNRVSILGVVNPKRSHMADALLEDVAVCFSIALFNKKHLNKTEAAAVTDSLTGAMNRVAYKKDILVFDEERPSDFSCIYIDVNELHLRNNKYGHAAGDEMLIYVANTLKEVFYGQNIYRMGGDEFLVFIKNVGKDSVKEDIQSFISQLESASYSVAIGMSYRKQNTDCEEMVREAEIRMYEAKAMYYQSKEKASISSDSDENYVRTKTGIREVDTMLSVLREHYNGIYRVSLDSDSAHRILMPSYLGYKENEENFSRLVLRYIDELVHPDFARPLTNFLNYDAIKKELSEGLVPRITYKKINGETVILSIYSLSENPEMTNETLWVFAKD